MTAVKEQPFSRKYKSCRKLRGLFLRYFILQIRQNSGLRDFEIVLKYFMYGQNLHYIKRKERLYENRI